MARNIRSQGEVKLLVGTTPRAFDPTLPGVLGSPIKDRSTVTITPILMDGGRGVVGRLTPVVPGVTPTMSTGTITVADNDFTTGSAEVILGDYHLLSYIDFQPAVLLADTAIALAAAINRFPGFRASISAPGVIVVRGMNGDDDQVAFEVRHFGTHTNFTLSPTSGFFTVGSPVLGPPVLSL